ncbi:MAG: hypothetical protein E5X33_29920 [Mesorhizobium sp.]|uniref:hypothetical protein n=1 Tax=Mesorhizobium sp. TaxID=1871066 RepID=UPI0011FEBADC|nr:hypothetical protein [Mesorhizobium sp.]TIR16151.1 MAG: hypothetical protein E5X33_29920 [Mesorhizobium sp.]
MDEQVNRHDYPGIDIQEHVDPGQQLTYPKSRTRIVSQSDEGAHSVEDTTVLAAARLNGDNLRTVRHHGQERMGGRDGRRHDHLVLL